MKEEILRLLPHVCIVDVLGSSETGRQGVNRSEVGGTAGAGFAPSRAAGVLSADLQRVLEPGDPELGWLTQTGRVPSRVPR